MMGCGASQSPIIPQVTQPRINHEESIKSKENSIKSSTMAKAASSSSSTTTNILISCHSESEKIAETLAKSFRQTAEYSCHVITEKSPQSLSSRANYIRWSDIFIVLINRAYQRTPFCMETINYAKDVSKLVVAILVQTTFQPYGALGAIAASAVGSFIWNENIFEQLKSNIASQSIKKKGPANISLNDTNSSELILVRGQSRCQILICATDDGAMVGQMIHRELLKCKHEAVFENLSQPTARCSIEHCSVFVPILSPGYELSSMCRAASEEARRTGKPIVPVIAIAKWRPEEWLGLTIAGLTFFRIFDEESAYKPFFDSNRIKDLRVAIEVAMTPVPTTEERERIETKVLKEKIEECKKQLKTWPPLRRTRTPENLLADRKAVRVKLEEPNAKLQFVHIHHSITRMEMKAPLTLLDEYGLPKRREIDCMISYQWDDQKLVRQVYEDMLMREIRAWFDIWGSMQGSTNDAMATGVECAKVMIVFLSKQYVKSKNCLLEFRYAVKRGKPFVILRTEPNIPMEQWMIESIEGFPQYDVFRYKNLEELINNVPLIDVIMQAVRALAQAQPHDIVDDCSVELLELRMLLDDARDALSAQTGQQRYKTCTRCGQQFDEYTKGGCHKHRSYYLGGTIIEGRWVCCRQQQRDSVGCEPCDHLDQKRVFTQDLNYGTWTWQPS